MTFRVEDLTLHPVVKQVCPATEDGVLLLNASKKMLLEGKQDMAFEVLTEAIAVFYQVYGIFIFFHVTVCITCCPLCDVIWFSHVAIFSIFSNILLFGFFFRHVKNELKFDMFRSNEKRNRRGTFLISSNIFRFR